MNQTPDVKNPAVTAAEGKLAGLGVQVEAMQAVLVRLLQDVLRAESRLANSNNATLVEANQHLVVAALTGQADAEAATHALQLAPAAGLDGLTQLPNRAMLLDRFEQAIAQARRRNARFAVLFLDLDNFKVLNDSHGHAFGDAVLRRVASQLQAAARAVDTVSRHGGDEFVVLMSELKQTADAQAVAAKLIAALAEPGEVDGQAVQLSASVGIAIYPDDGGDADTLIAHADAAMYGSKRRGPGGIALHSAGAPGRLSPALRAPAAGDAESRQAQLREANEKLVLAALGAQELQEAAERAQQRQTAFMAAVADELRNPAAPIRIAAAMLGRVGADALLLLRIQGIVEEQLSNMSRLVGDLVEASAQGAGGLKVEHRRVDMAAVIASAVAAHRPVMQARGQRFEAQLPPGAIEVLGDRARLEQVLDNLLDNASKHTHEGGQISLAVDLSDDTLTLTVADNGIGISAATLEHIFEPFVQDVHALGFNGVGLGIGLTVVRALLRAHGGNLVALSAGVGRGSRFVATLPRAPVALGTAGAVAAIR